jgi:hypothetical protein
VSFLFTGVLRKEKNRFHPDFAYQELKLIFYKVCGTFTADGGATLPLALAFKRRLGNNFDPLPRQNVKRLNDLGLINPKHLPTTVEKKG